MQLQNNKILQNLRQSKYLERLPSGFKQEKAQKFTSVMLTFIALSFFALFAINPTISTILGLRRELEDNQFTQEQLTQKINNLSSLGRAYQQIETDIPYVLASMPQDPEIALLMAQIQAMAQDSGATLIGLQTFQVEVSTPKTAKKKYSSFAFSLSTEGDYNNTLKLIDLLSQMQRVVSLDVIALNRKADLSGIIQLSLKGTAYFKN